MQEHNPSSLLGKGQAGEKDIEQLIRLGGEREEIDPACRERVRQHVYAAWLKQKEKSASRSKGLLKKLQWQQSWSLAAGIAGFCIALFFFYSADQREVFATLANVRGEIRLQNHTDIYTEQTLDTADALVALRLPGGAILKLDRQTRVHFLHKNELRLLAGGLYFDSNNAEKIRIHTPHGIVSDIGTQFETRLQTLDLLVRVREGKVRIDEPRRETLFVNSGKALHLSDTKAEILELKPHDQQWLWIEAIEDDFNFDGRTMADVLLWVAKRENWILQFKRDIDKQEASEDILHGQLQTRDSRELLEQLTLVSDMRYQIKNKVLLVSYP